MNGQKGSKWTVQKDQSGRSKTVKVDGPKSLKWTVTNKKERSKKVRMEELFEHRIRVHLRVGYNYGERALRIRIHLGLG